MVGASLSNEFTCICKESLLRCNFPMIESFHENLIFISVGKPTSFDSIKLFEVAL